MRIGSVPDVRQRLLLMLAASQREPTLIRRRRQGEQVPETFQPFREDVAARGLAEETPAEALAE